MRTFVNCIQTKCLYSVLKGPHGQPSCAIDCFLLCYHLKVSTKTQNGDATTIVKLLCACSSAMLDVALHTEGSLSLPVQDHTLQHLLEGAYRMFKLFRGSYAYITESKGLEGLKVQLSQFYDKVRTYHKCCTGGTERPALCGCALPWDGVHGNQKEADMAPLCGTGGCEFFAKEAKASWGLYKKSITLTNQNPPNRQHRLLRHLPYIGALDQKLITFAKMSQSPEPVSLPQQPVVTALSSLLLSVC